MEGACERYTDISIKIVKRNRVVMGTPALSNVSIKSDGTTKKSVSGFKSIFVSSPTQIWRSKVSRRVALAAFMTILLVQTLVLNIGGIEKYRQELLTAREQQAISAIAGLLHTPSVTGAKASPFDAKKVEKLLSISDVTGISVYSYLHQYIETHGNYPHLRPEFGGFKEKYILGNGDFYEFILSTSDTKSKYVIVAQIRIADINEQVQRYVVESLIIMAILSLLVTTVLMIALGKWLLEPILFMRANLIAAFKNPENPDINESPFSVNDEIGAAIDLTQKLILQNAENINHLKSTAEDKIHRLAYYDTLTGLPNRILFVQNLGDCAKVGSDGSVLRFAVVALDLDHFKDINDSMGHNVGDAILRAVGKRLRASLPESAIVSRTGEDEFAVMMPLSGDAISAKDVADRVQGVVRGEMFKVFNEEFQVRSSVGVSVYPDDGSEPEIVLKNADIALNRAKEDGRDRVCEYSEDFDRAVQERFQMLRDLRNALEQDELQLFFQPQLCLKTGKVIGAEALLRWWKPDNSKAGGNFISPGVFIPVAEQSGLIVPMGQWVLNRAFQVAQMCQDEHGFDVRIAVNVSGNQFMSGDICAEVSRLLEETGVRPDLIELEVTESIFMDEIEHTVQILHNLHALGIELAIDDFGTGYSSLSYLSQFPIDRLKIDQSFIRNALNDNHNASIAKTIINLGHSLNLKVIAEGVETKDHEDFLVEQGCDEVQGFRYSRPVPVDEFVDFVKSYNGDLSSFVS